MNPTKPWYLSKTLWINGLAFIGMIVQSTTGFIVDPAIQATALAVINFIVRLITKKELTAEAS